MNTKAKRALIVSGSVLGGIIVTLLVLYFAVMGIALLIAKNHHTINEILRTQGPWNGEASLWVSEDENLYIHVPGTAEIAGEVQGFVKTRDGNWEACILHKQNYPGVRLTFRNGLIFEAKAKIKDGDLVLTEIEFSAEGTFPEWENLTLRKYSVEDKIDEYPSPPQLD